MDLVVYQCRTTGSLQSRTEWLVCPLPRPPTIRQVSHRVLEYSPIAGDFRPLFSLLLKYLPVAGFGRLYEDEAASRSPRTLVLGLKTPYFVHGLLELPNDLRFRKWRDDCGRVFERMKDLVEKCQKLFSAWILIVVRPLYILHKCTPIHPFQSLSDGNLGGGEPEVETTTPCWYKSRGWDSEPTVTRLVQHTQFPMKFTYLHHRTLKCMKVYELLAGTLSGRLK